MLPNCRCPCYFLAGTVSCELIIGLNLYWESSFSFLVLTVNVPECFSVLKNKKQNANLPNWAPELEMREKVQKPQVAMSPNSQNTFDIFKGLILFYSCLLTTEASRIFHSL